MQRNIMEMKPSAVRTFKDRITESKERIENEIPIVNIWG